MANISIYLTNLGKYNEGELVGEWVDLPVSDEELAQVLQRIGISDKPDANGNYYEEYFITDYESDIPGLYIGEYDNLNSLNDLAEAVEGLDNWDLKKFENAMDAGFISLDDIVDFDPSRYILYENVQTTQDLGIAMVEDLYGDLTNMPRSELENYFDFEAYGRDYTFDFLASDALNVDEDDPEEVARICEMYGVDDLEDITVYKYFGVSEGDDTTLGEILAEDVSLLDNDTLERYFDYEGYGSDVANYGGAFTQDGFIEDTRR